MSGPTELIRQNCPIATPSNDGLMSKEQAAKLALLATADNVNIYVDATSGSDTTGDGSQGSPYQTVEKAISELPPMWSASEVVIHCAAGTYPFSGETIWIGMPIGVGATPLQILGTPVDSGLGTLTMVTGTNNLQAVANTAATVNGAYRGAYLRNTTTGSRTMVTGNTFSAGKTTFTLLKSDDAVEQTVGDTFVVETPGAIFQAPEFGTVPLHASGSIGFGLRDIKFQAHPDSALDFIPVAVLFGEIFYEAVVFDGVIGRPAYGQHNTRWNSTRATTYWADAPENPFSGDRAMAGLFVTNSGLTIADRCLIGTTIVADGSLMDVTNRCELDLYSCDFDGCILLCSNASTLNLNVGTVLNAPNFGFDAAIVASDDSIVYIGLGGVDTFDISDSAVGALAALNKSQVQAGILTGTGNATHGIIADEMSLLLVDQFGGTTDVTGTTGNLSIDGATKAYADAPFNGTALSRVA